MKKQQHYDLIGDIHGHYDKLVALLEGLDYQPHGDHYRHPEGRKIVFLGDYIDRGPKIRETLQLVRALVDAGEALAIMGNHEFNAIAYATPDGNGEHLRKRTPDKIRQHAATLAAFAGREHEWAEWIEWMKRLPMFLELGDLRAVHAAWAAEHIAFLHDKSLLDINFLRAAATKGTAEYAAVEIVLKGPELKLPDGLKITDKENIERDMVRIRWWNLREGMPIGDLVMPKPMENLLALLRRDDMNEVPNYAADAPPVFFGHYWMPADAAKAPFVPNVACLDYSGAFENNPLTAYRWDGERGITTDKFVTSTHDHE